MDKLISAETLDGGQLRKAATLKCDESILVQIRGKDCVALEMKYHKQCYKNYISFLTHHKEDPEATSSKGTSPLYGKSFEAFCEQFVQTHVGLARTPNLTFRCRQYLNSKFKMPANA